MDRRKALVQMGLSMGYVVAAPTFAGLLQSCKDEKTVEWLPHLLTEAEGSLLQKLVDVILPKTDTPSASELNVHKFIDYFAAECFEQEQQDVFKTTLAELAKKARSTSGKTGIGAKKRLTWNGFPAAGVKLISIAISSVIGPKGVGTSTGNITSTTVKLFVTGVSPSFAR